MERIGVALAESDRLICEKFETKLEQEDSLNLVGIADNGLDAWEIIIKNQPDVVVMDILMPYMDGLEILDKINRNIGIRRPKIIITTVMSNDAIVKEAFRRGVDYYIVKPYDENMIATRIKQLYFESQREENSATYSIDAAIESNLSRLNFPVNLKGYQYLISAIKEVVIDDEMLYGVTKVLYPEIAKKHQSTAARVEKAIRHAIEVAWSRCDEKTILEFWNNNKFQSKRRPTNSELIAIIAQRVKSIDF